MRDTLRRLYDEAVATPETERETFVASQDTTNREELRRLLRTRARMGAFLESPAIERFVQPAIEPGRWVGAYRVVRVVGTGGAATVYEALQRNPQRRVALKVLRTVDGSRGSHRRFRDEAQILARLEHPDIAHVYEAGVHESAPYIAMEFVAGARRVTEHAAGLETAGKLELFARICDAIHHGHQKGVIHRDIKPANILVQGNGQLKVIDFGIAKVEGEGTFELAGTLPYMSPGQFASPDEVDVRTDVYALGVLLHELLAGRHLFDVEDVPLAEAARRIREDEPRMRVGGERGAIVRKACARNRDDRYPSAAALADDVRRHLGHRPVDAYPAGPLYHLRKFARRRLGAFLAAVAAVVVVVAAALVGSWLAVEKARESRIARAERRRAEFQGYVANLAAASGALRMNDVGEARLRLDAAAAEFRNWEWRHLVSRLDRSERTIGGFLGGPVRGSISPDGALVAGHGAVRRYVDGSPAYPLPEGHYLTAFSPDGARLVVARRRIEIRDAASGRVERTCEGNPEGTWTVAFDPGGREFATGARGPDIRIWSAETGRLVRTLRDHRDWVMALAYDPRGGRLFSGGGAGEETTRSACGISARERSSGGWKGTATTSRASP